MARGVVLFDLDGTLTDPAAGIFNSVRNAVAVLGLAPLTNRALRQFVGPPLRESFASLGLGRSGVEAAIVAYRAHFSEVGLYENAPYPGIEAALRELVAGGLRLAVATSKPTVFAERILVHFALDGYFDAVVGSEFDGGRSDKHEVIIATLRRLSAFPYGGVMVGDRQHDILGAARAGMSCIGVSWGYAGLGELEAAGACQVIHRPEDLPPAIQDHRPRP
jgi:phosphoglycolate phosphatase